jgi:hypothetical protein
MRYRIVEVEAMIGRKRVLWGYGDRDELETAGGD